MSHPINLRQPQFDGEDRRAETEDRRQKLEQQRMRVRAKGGGKETGKNEEEQRQLNQELHVLDEKAVTARDGKTIKLCVCVYNEHKKAAMR